MHVLTLPRWHTSAEYDRFPAGGGYDLKCTCGWRSPLETAPRLAELRGARHLATSSRLDRATRPS